MADRRKRAVETVFDKPLLTKGKPEVCRENGKTSCGPGREGEGGGWRPLAGSVSWVGDVTYVLRNSE